MPEPTQPTWGLDNPHPLSHIKTELNWAGKYNADGRKGSRRCASSCRYRPWRPSTRAATSTSSRSTRSARAASQVAQPPNLGRQEAHTARAAG